MTNSTNSNPTNKRTFCKRVEESNPGIVCRWKSETNEYRVNFRDGTEDSAYYTNDADDAAGTARAMWNQRYYEPTKTTTPPTSSKKNTDLETLRTLLNAELSRLEEEYRSSTRRAISIAEEYRDRRVSTHFGHNLGNVANELSMIAGKIEEVDGVLRTVENAIEIAETKETK